MAGLGMILPLEIFLVFYILLLNVQGENVTTCPEGFYGKRTHDGKLVCNTCAVCSPGTEVKAKCMNQSDTVCRSCDPGTFSSGGIKCANCSLCPPGSHLTDYCSLTSDTRCVPCEKDRYSSDWSTSRYCKPCSRCSRLRMVLKNCSSTQNYECGDCIKGYFRHPNLPTCMKCSYCYPDINNVTFPVTECTTQSDDPNMRCMPVPPPPRARPVMFAGIKDNEAHFSTTNSSIDQAISSTQFPNQDALIPPYIAIPIITVGASSVVLVLTLVIIYKMRHKCGLFQKRRNLYRQRQPGNAIETVLMNRHNGSESPLQHAGCSEHTSSDEENIEKKMFTIKVKTTHVDESDVDCNVPSPGVLSPLTRTPVLERNEEIQRCSYYAANEGFEEEEEQEEVDASKPNPPAN